MQKINDLQKNLPEDIDLTDSINKTLRVSNKTNFNSLDLKKGLRSLNIRKKRIISFLKLKKKTLDTIFEGKKKKIDINTRKDKSINIKLKRFKFIFKNNFIKKEKLGFPKKYKIIFFLVFGSLFLLTLDILLLQLNVKSGYYKILSIKEGFSDTKKVKGNISGARNNFFISKILFTPFSIIPNSKLNNLGNLISGGKNFTNLLDEAIFLYEDVNFLVNKNSLENINFIKLLEGIESNSINISNQIELSLLDYNQIGDLGNKDLNDKLNNLKNKLELSYNFIDKLNKNYDIMFNLLAKNEERRYLIVFQNNDEIRPTGGFMGSFASLYLSNGKIQKIEKQDVYAYEWLINKNYKDKIKAPEGLNYITKNFGLRDANYFPEIKDSSNQIKFFFDKIPYNIDGIIYINQNLVKGLIDSVGYVDSNVFGEKITSDNFSVVISSLVEAEVTKVGTIGTPKKALFDFSEELYTKLLGERKYYDYFNVLLKNIASRDLVFYSFHPEENSLLWKLGLNGDINFKETLDFNYPVYTSIGGNKTDRYLNYKYEKFINKIPETCDFKTKLSIYNKSNFSKTDEDYINKILSKYKNLGKNKNDILNIQGKGVNKSYLRILLPKNAKVKLNNGQKLSETENYKIIEFYTHTRFSEKSVYEIDYILENPNCKDYNYKFIKQPGITNYDISFMDMGSINVYENINTDFIYKKVVN